MASFISNEYECIFGNPGRNPLVFILVFETYSNSKSIMTCGLGLTQRWQLFGVSVLDWLEPKMLGCGLNKIQKKLLRNTRLKIN